MFGASRKYSLGRKVYVKWSIMVTYLLTYLLTYLHMGVHYAYLLTYLLTYLPYLTIWDLRPGL